MRSIVLAISLVMLLGSTELKRADAQKLITQKPIAQNPIDQNLISQALTPQQEALQQFDIGEKQFQANQFENARTAYENALKIWVKLDRKSPQGSLHLKLAQVDEVLGQYDRAMENYQNALKIFSALNRPIERSGSLSGIGIIFVRTGKYSQAIESFQNALKIYPESSVALNGLGLAHAYLGESKTALKFYEQSLELRVKNQLFSAAAATLLNMGTVYEDQGDYSKALIFYRRGLSFFESSKYPSGWSQALNEMGRVYNRLNQPEKALENFQKALTIATQYKDRRRQGQSLEHIGLIYQKRQDYNQAIEFYNKSLSLRRSIGDREGEASVLNHMGDSLRENKDFDLAILFYKESVNRYEIIRTDLRQLPREQQSSYLKTVERTYRNLADVLLKRDRILEAQQVLDLLKFQELEQYLNTVRGTSRPPENLLPEVEILRKYDGIQKSAIELGKELSNLRQVPEAARTSQQQQRIAKLVQLEEDLSQQFNQFRDRPDIQALLEALSPKVRKQTIDTADLEALRSDLKKLDAVLIYPLVLDDRLEIIITTPDAPPLRRTVNVKREELNRTIRDFRSALSNPEEDLNIPSQQLYDWLIKPLEADLQVAQPKTLIYAPDAQLRYIPLAALRNGNQWLIERYAINYITAKSLLKFTQAPPQKPKILAGAIGTQSSQVDVGTRSFTFKGLPFTTTEVQSIQALQPTTQSLIESNFTLSNIKAKLGDYNILHLATHAALVPGNPESSFILFNGKTIATLKDIENWTLNNFDLVVLSACETGLGGNFGSNGEEILGLGYQFQNRGVKATIASLWQVDDGGTQALMLAFYTELQQGKSKNQSLQSAQRSLLKDPKLQRFSHPYYWAPFILIGNGL
jgi:CHAT domain-containing protein/tetratricopeptide (TPR) repeat protein